jgi:hypothetical protein
MSAGALAPTRTRTGRVISRGNHAEYVLTNLKRPTDSVHLTENQRVVVLWQGQWCLAYVRACTSFHTHQWSRAFI